MLRRLICRLFGHFPSANPVRVLEVGQGLRQYWHRCRCCDSPLLDTSRNT